MEQEGRRSRGRPFNRPASQANSPTSGQQRGNARNGSAPNASGSNASGWPPSVQSRVAEARCTGDRNASTFRTGFSGAGHDQRNSGKTATANRAAGTTGTRWRSRTRPRIADDLRQRVVPGRIARNMPTPSRLGSTPARVESHAANRPAGHGGSVARSCWSARTFFPRAMCASRAA
jgi:hypothetical protein